MKLVYIGSISDDVLCKFIHIRLKSVLFKGNVVIDVSSLNIKGTLYNTTSKRKVAATPLKQEWNTVTGEADKENTKRTTLCIIVEEYCNTAVEFTECNNILPARYRIIR